MTNSTARLVLSFLAFLLFALAGRLEAHPRFSLLTGTRCSACHYNPQGSGPRTELGWSTMNQVGMISPSSLGLDSLYAAETSLMFDGMLTLGLDFRLQLAKIGRPPATQRLLIPMQTMPYAAFIPTEWLTIYGGYNLSETFSSRKYPGQVPYEFAAQIQPGVTSPLLKVGFIQPSIGVRQDDHTVFTRREVARFNTTLIPPNYVELGAEATYEGINWLTVNAGAYTARHLAQVDRTVDSTKPSFSGRLMIWPQLLDEGLNGELGASALVNGDFRMFNLFGGIGLADKGTIFAEAMYSKNSNERQIRNLSVIGTYLLTQWLSLHWRYDWGQTEDTPLGKVYQAHGFTLGAEIFLLPYIELRPEYRYFENENYLIGQYTVQLHLFY
jgi:hypothetical protein